MNYSFYLTIYVNDTQTVMKVEAPTMKEAFDTCVELINNKANIRFLDITKHQMPEVGKPYNLPYTSTQSSTLPQSDNDPCYLCGAAGCKPRVKDSRHGGKYCSTKKGDEYCTWTSKKPV